MARAVKRKNYYLDEKTIKQAQQILWTKTETETVQKALELVVNEARLAQALKNLPRERKGTFTIEPPRGRKIIFDTNVYIEAIRGGPEAPPHQLLLTLLRQTYLSAVVVQELYTGALNSFGERLVDMFVRQTEKTGRIVTPTYRDWKQTEVLPIVKTIFQVN